jgi:hypothetical protein
MTATLERQETLSREHRLSAKWWLVAALMLFAAAIGVAAGFWWGNSGDETPRVVTAQGVELSDRQQQMVDLMDEYEAAWRSGDVAAFEALVTTDFRYIESADSDYPDVYLWSDGSFQDRVSGGLYSSIEVYEPYLVHEDLVAAGGDFGMVIIEFRPGMPLAIQSHTHLG